MIVMPCYEKTVYIISKEQGADQFGLVHGVSPAPLLLQKIYFLLSFFYDCSTLATVCSYAEWLDSFLVRNSNTSYNALCKKDSP